jgi:glycosyltransferase
LRNPKFSVLLIVKNALALVTGALNSLKHQTFKDFEVVVVDGASTDGTLGLLHEAAKELPLRIVSEADRSLAEGFAKALRRATGEIVGMLCADERYYPNTLEQVLKWFEAEPNAVMCGGKVDFIDEHDKVIGSDLTAPFNLPAHLACELVPSNLASFFNRPFIGDDFRFDADVPTCPDYEYWSRLGFRFPESAFKRYDVSVAQAYRTRDSMSFRAESFTQFCRDKLTHLNNLLAKGYAGADHEALRLRAFAGIHMWAAEQLRGIEPGHPDILAHCAAAARYDKSDERIARFLATVDHVRYDAASGTVRRNLLSPRTAAIAEFECSAPPSYWVGAAILGRDPLTLQTASAPWGFSLEMSVLDKKSIGEHFNGGQYWARIDLEVIEGCVGISMFAPNQDVFGELVFEQAAGRAVALIPLTVDPTTPVMVRSGGRASSVARIYRAELLYDPDSNSNVVSAIELGN